MERNLKDLIDSKYQVNQPSAELEQKIALFKEEIDRLNFTIKEQKLLIQAQKEKLENLQDIESLEKKVTELTNQLMERRDSSNPIANNEEYSLTQTIIAELSEENENLQRKVSDLTEQLSSAQKNVAELKKLEQNAAVIGQLKQENKDLLQKLQETKENISQLQNQANLVKESKPNDEKDALIAQLNQENEDLFRKFQKANYQISELQASVAQLKKEAEELLQKSQALGQHDSSQEEKVTVDTKQLEDKDAIIKLLMQEKTDLLQEVKTTYELVSDLQSKVVDSKQLKEKEDIISQLNEHNLELNRKIKENDEKLVELQAKAIDAKILTEKEEMIAQLVQENERILDQLKNANNEIQQLKQTPIEDSIKKPTDELKLASEKIQYLKEENDDLQSQVSLLQSELDGTGAVEETPEMAKREEDFVTALQKSLEEENSKLKNDLANATSRINNLETEKKQSESRTTDINKEITEREAKIKDLNEKVETYRQQIEKLKIEFNELLERDHVRTQGQSNEEKANDGSQESRIKALTDENNRLNSLLSGQTSKESASLEQEPLNFNFDKNTPKEYQTWFFSKNLALLNQDAKSRIKGVLISSLKHDNINVKAFAMNLLKVFNDDETLEAISIQTSDKDWLVRLYALKALEAFPTEKSRKFLEALAQDSDVDVREAARKTLKYLK